MERASIQTFILLLFLTIWFPTAGAPATAQETKLLDRFQERVTTFRLDNGLSFLVFERHEAPVVSCVTYVDAGSANEHWGVTGMAHMFEHMAFKGTRTIGTKNYQKEKNALKKVDRAFRKLLEERRKDEQADPANLKKRKKQFQQAQKNAQKYIIRNDFTKMLQRAGAESLNAYTSADNTAYMASLPANKLELWFAMESERFLNPVLREFFKERDVVLEEKRNRENNPVGRLFSEVISAAYRSHPYGVPIIGNTADLKTFTRADARSFFETYYVPRNMVVSIVGDVSPEQVQNWAEQYFGRLPDRPAPEPVDTREPTPDAEVRVQQTSRAQPSLIMAYQGVSIRHSDYRALEALASILGDGRTSRLHRRIVQEKKLARNVNVYTGYPGNKFKGQVMLFAQNNPDVSTAKLETEIEAVLNNVRENGVRPEELKRVRTKKRASLIRQMDDNLRMALNLSRYEVLLDDWRAFFRQVEQVQDLTVEQVNSAAKKYLTEERRVTGMIRTTSGDEGEENQ